MKSLIKFKRINSRKAVSPIIATLLLVAVAVVGGGLNFTIAQNYFNSAQASGLAGIETILYIGYDATDSDSLRYHDGILSNPVPNWHGNQIIDGLKKDERIAIFVQNHSVHKVSLEEVRVAGSVYTYQNMGPSNKMTPYSSSLLESGEYAIVKNGNNNASADTIKERSPVLQPGQTVSIVLEIDKDIKIDRDMQVRLTTSNGSIFVYTVLAGQTLS